MGGFYCDVAPGHPDHGPYHDREYGFPLKQDAELFERLALEINQAGLSWLTILRKRAAFRRAFRGFDPAVVARFGARDRARLLADSGIIRNRLKVDAVIANARTLLELRRSHGSFVGWLDAHHPLPKPEWLKLFKQTFRFTGGEIVGEFLMSTGYLPGAHRESCPVYRKIARLKPAWMRVKKSAGRAVALAVALLALGTATVRAAPSATDAPKPPGRYAQVNGIRMYYEEHGQGPVLVLLHGGAGNGQQFEHQIPDFERRFHLIVPDMCAQGRSSDRRAPLSFHAMAEDVIALMNQLHVAHFDVMGWSDGGVTGLDIAIHHPDRLRRLVTFGANFAPDGLNPTDVAWNDTATVSAFGDGMREGWTKLSPEPAHYAVAMSKIIQLWKTEPRFTRRQLASIRAKVLICAGEHDVIRLEHTQALAQAIPGAEMWIVPGASHGAMLEKPAEVNARVVEFLTR
jgi:DNA-3-methyladenine glycosylase I